MPNVDNVLRKLGICLVGHSGCWDDEICSGRAAMKRALKRKVSRKDAAGEEFLAEGFLVKILLVDR